MFPKITAVRSLGLKSENLHLYKLVLLLVAVYIIHTSIYLLITDSHDKLRLAYHCSVLSFPLSFVDSNLGPAVSISTLNPQISVEVRCGNIFLLVTWSQFSFTHRLAYYESICVTSLVEDTLSLFTPTSFDCQDAALRASFVPIAQSRGTSGEVVWRHSLSGVGSHPWSGCLGLKHYVWVQIWYIYIQC